MSRRRSGIKGIASYRRLLKRLPDSAHNGLVDVLREAGPSLADKMKSRLPSKTGALRAGISWRLLEKTLNLKVGLLQTPSGRAKLFYGHILDVGRKAKTKTVRRTSKLGNISTYVIHTRAKSGLFVISKGLADFRADFLPSYQQVTTRILIDASKGAGDD